MKKIITILFLFLSVGLFVGLFAEDSATTPTSKNDENISQVSNDANISEAKSTQLVQPNILNTNLKANENEVLIDGNATANQEVEIVILLGSERIVKNTTANNEGVWKLVGNDFATPLRDGMYDIFVSSKDENGSKSEVASLKSILKDTKINGKIAFDDGSEAKDSYINHTELSTFFILGTIDSDSKIVNITIKDEATKKETILDSKIVSFDKAFNFTIKSKDIPLKDFADGELELKVDVEDNSGNKLTLQAKCIKDTTAPVLPQITKSIKNENMLNAQVQNILVFLGTGEKDNKIEVTLYNKKNPTLKTTGFAKVDNSSNWTMVGRDFEAKKLEYGDIVAEIVAIDQSGNKSEKLILNYKKEPNPIFPKHPVIILPEEYMTVDSIKDVGDVIKSIVVNDNYVIASTYGMIYYFDKEKCKVQKKIEIKQHWINSLALYEDKLIVALDNGQIQIRDLNSTKLITTLDGENLPVLFLKLSGNNLVSSSSDGTITVWDLKEKKQIYTLRKHQWDVSAIAIQDGKIYSGSDDYSIKIWDMKSGKFEKNLKSAHKGTINALVIYENKLISASDDGTIQIRDIKTNALIKVLDEHKKGVTALRINHDKLISASNDRTLIVWNLKTYKKERQLRGHSKSIVSLEVNNENIITGSLDYTMKVWGVDETMDKSGDVDEAILAKYDLIKSLNVSDDIVTSLAQTQNEIIFSTFGNIYFYNNVTYLPTRKYTTLDEVRTIAKKDKKEESSKKVEVSSGEAVIFDAVLDQKRKIMDEEASKNPQWVNSINLQGNRLFAALGYKNLKIWDLEANKAIKEVDGHESSVLNIIRSDDRIISSSADGAIKIWGQEKMDLMMSIDAHQWDIKTMVAEDGTLYTGSDDYSIKIWDMETGDLLENIKSAHNDKITALGIYKNLLISGSIDGKLIFKDKETLTTLKEIDVKSPINKFVIDGKMIISGNEDGSITVVDIEKLKKVKTIEKAHIGGISAIMTTDDYIISGGKDKKINIWKYYE